MAVELQLELGCALGQITLDTADEIVIAVLVILVLLKPSHHVASGVITADLQRRGHRRMTAEEYEDGIVQHEDALMLRDVVELHEQLGRAERCVRSAMGEQDNIRATESLERLDAGEVLG